MHCSPESSSHAASSLHDRALTCVCGWHGAHRMFLSPCCDLHERIRPVFNVVLSKVSPDSLNLLVILCAVNGEIVKSSQFYVQEDY